MSESLTKSERITRSSELRRLFQTARFSRVRGVKLGHRPNHARRHRVAFTPTRGLRRAVDRNHQKRISREAFRRLKATIPGSYDFVFVLYGDASTTTRERTAEVVRLLAAADLR